MTTPRQIGKYTVLGEIASGAQGAVYRAIDPSTAMTVAVKVLIGQRVTDVKRLRREASLVQAIDHQNVVKLIEVGESEGLHFMAMEFIPETLSNLIEVTGALPIERAVALAIGISDGLGYAHQHGIVHHDIKPQNVLLTPEGIPKVTDFGIARAEMFETMTATGVGGMGTVPYMSPEQIDGERGDPRSDVYSLGCMLYELLSGEVPFSGSMYTVLRSHKEEHPEPLRSRVSGIPDAIAKCVEQAMAKDPAQRYADGNAFSDAMRSALSAAPEAAGQESDVPPTPEQVSDDTRRIGKYTIQGELGSAGQGAVYRAIDSTDPGSDAVAVKILHAKYSNDFVMVQRFQREASLTQQIQHRNVVRIFDQGESDGQHYMAMEFMPNDLDKLIKSEGALDPSRAIKLAASISEGVGQAHSQGIVHHDIKPGNVLLTADEIPKVIDFGIARTEESGGTVFGTPMGSPPYMAPEQWVGVRGDPRSDVYSLGCLLYQLLSGEVPFRGTQREVQRLHEEEQPQPLRNMVSGIPDDIVRCVEQAMAKNPEQRFPDGNAFASALRNAISDVSNISDAASDSIPADSDSEDNEIRIEIPDFGDLGVSQQESPGGSGKPPDQLSSAESVGGSENPPWWGRSTRLWILLVVVIIAVIIAIIGNISGTDDPKIAFHSMRDGNADIYIMDADGSNQTRLTSNSGADRYPSWSPDGSKIAFESNRDRNDEIYVMDADGSNQTRLTSNPGSDRDPSWSPDGSKIAFTSDRHGNNEIYVMNADGSGHTRLIYSSAGEWDPSWSPDGSKIAFTSDRHGNNEIYVMDADGSYQISLTTDNASDKEPSWSPDGSHIAFLSSREGNIEIYVMDADGSNVTRLTDNPVGEWDEKPSWSPDGSKIAFTSARHGNQEIYVMDVDGSNRTRLTSNSEADRAPSWWGPALALPSLPTPVSIPTPTTVPPTAIPPTAVPPTAVPPTAVPPTAVLQTPVPTASPTVLPTPEPIPLPVSSDGKIAFSSNRDGNYEIYVMDADGSNQTRLTSNPAYGHANRFPSWSPDGSKIAFASSVVGGFNIWMMNADGSNQTRLTNKFANENNPSWSPDGSKIAFSSNRKTGASRQGENIFVMNTDGSHLINLSNKGWFDASPSWSPNGSKIAFASYRGGNNDVYVMDADGSNEIRLTSNSADDSSPALSPDGSKITFVSNRDGNNDIYVMDADGSNQISLTSNSVSDHHPSWSPDGSKITFASNRDGNNDIYVMDADGSNQISLTSNDTWDEQPDWRPVLALPSLPTATPTPTPTPTTVPSTAIPPTAVRATAIPPTAVLQTPVPTASPTVLPTPEPTATPTPDGSKIVFTSGWDEINEIFIMDADGSNQTRLTSNPAYDHRPSLSPDGSKIAFTSVRDPVYLGNWGIYVMDADGSAQTHLSNNSAYEDYPSWSPDGSKIAFTSSRDGNNQIYVMDADGSNQTRLTDNSASESNPDWSPDGSKIVFGSTRGGYYGIYIMDADGSNQTSLTSNDWVGMYSSLGMKYDAEPSWSPDGSKIAFTSHRDGNSEIYVMDADGSNQTRLTSNSADSMSPSWSPDGLKIAYQSSRGGYMEIWVMDLNGSNQTRLTFNSVTAGTPFWGPAISTPLPSGTPASTPIPQNVSIQSVEGTLSHDAVNVGGIFELQNFRVVNVEELNKLGGVSASVKWGDNDDEWIGVPILVDTGEIINLSHAYQSAGTFSIDLRIKSDSGDVVEYSYEIVVS